MESTVAKVGRAPQTLHTWVKQHEIDAGQRDGVSTADAQRIKELERQSRELIRPGFRGSWVVSGRPPP